MRKKQIIVLSAFIAILLAVALIWVFNRPAPVQGAKTITLEVIHGDGSSKSFNIPTDAETLGEALKSVDGLIAGENSAYGLMVNTVDGETADWNRDQSWWCLSQDGKPLDTGIDSTMISDGEHYEFIYTVG